MSLGLFLQFGGTALIVVGTIMAFWGGYISPKGDNIFNFIQNVTVRNFFSETQSIKVLPPSLGGNNHLNLDNVATLRLHVPYSNNSITLLLDVVTTSLPVQTEGPVQAEGLEIYNQSSGTEYLFDTTQNKRHEMAVGGRTFVVTLLRVSKLDIPDVPSAIEYEFGISEK